MREDPKLNAEQRETLKIKIKKKQTEAKKILSDLKDLKERKKGRCVYSYI